MEFYFKAASSALVVVIADTYAHKTRPKNEPRDVHTIPFDRFTRRKIATVIPNKTVAQSFDGETERERSETNNKSIGFLPVQKKYSYWPTYVREFVVETFVS